MKHQRYQELNKEGKEIRQVSITKEQAERLNSKSKQSGISYKLVKGAAKAEPKTKGAAKAEPKTDK